MTEHKVGTREEWEAAHEELLKRETEEQMKAEEIQSMIKEPPDWLAEWAGQVGTDLATGLIEGPGWIVFTLENGVVHHTYSRFAPDGALLAPYCYQLLDQVPKGRGEVQGNSPRRVRGRRDEGSRVAGRRPGQRA